jgi:uncharacterized C2H2 Zn-finger protein
MDTIGSLELIEVNIQNGKKFVKCKCCGLVHLREKDFLGRRQLEKVYKNPNTA